MKNKKIISFQDKNFNLIIKTSNKKYKKELR